MLKSSDTGQCKVILQFAISYTTKENPIELNEIIWVNAYQWELVLY